MTKRRSRGDGGLHWDAKRERWIATATLGFTPAGRRITKKASGKTKTEAKTKLKEVLRDLDDGLGVGQHGYTVADATAAWLKTGLPNRDEETVKNCTSLANTHIVPELGKRRLRELTADEVDDWLADRSKLVARSTLIKLLSILRRIIRRAQARDLVKRNVALLCEVPAAKDGRPSKSLTLDQASRLLDVATATRMHAYIVVSLLTGARTEEMRALTWDHVDLKGSPYADPPRPPSIEVWRSVRERGDTKTRKSRRTLRLPERCVDALRDHLQQQEIARATAGDRWRHHNLVFCTSVGTELDAANVRRAFRRVVALTPGLNAADWTPRELRHSFVSLLSASGVQIEQISQLVGHKSTQVTETVYRHELRPVLTEGAEAMDEILPRNR
jgi:integrase